MNRRILVVDDNETIHRDFDKILSDGDSYRATELDALEAEILGQLHDPPADSNHYTIAGASSGQVALQKVREALAEGRPFALAFVDMRMPSGWDGLETAEYLWQVDPLLQIVLCTAYSDYSWDDLEARVVSAENLLLIKKPFDVMEIRQAAASLTLRRHHIEQAQGQIAGLESRLQLSQESLATILDAAPVGILTSDPQGRVLSLNRAAQDLLGWREPGFLIAEALASPSQGRTREGVLFPVLVSSVQLDLPDGQRTLSILTDLSERQKLESQFFQAQKLEGLGQVAGGVAHGFNNILLGILGQTDSLLDRQDLPPELREPLVHIKAQALQGAALTRQMLSYAGKASCNLRQRDLNRIVSDMAPMLKATVGPNIAWRLELGSGTLAVEADEQLLQQVILNLITNSAQALGEGGGHITVSTGTREVDAEELASSPLTFSPGRYHFIGIQDDGPGIPAEQRSRIFEPFYTTYSENCGLGLSAALGIVRLHSGTVVVKSPPSGGLLTEIYLPPGLAPAREKAPAPARGSRHGKLLLVDDQELVRRATMAMLKRLGFEVLTCSQGQEALEVFAQEQDNLVGVLMDISMPGLDGRQVRLEMQKRKPGLPVLLMSGYAPEESEDFFLQKPFTLATLEQSLGSIGQG